MENDKLFEFMEKMYGEMNSRFDKLEKEAQKTNMSIEQDIKPTLSALLDGYKQNAEQLEQIKEEVSRHEEVIIKRVK